MAGLTGLFAVGTRPNGIWNFPRQLFVRSKSSVSKFDWPQWPEKKEWRIGDLLDEHYPNIVGLRGSVDILAGRPPCQEFSFSRKKDEVIPECSFSKDTFPWLRQ